MRIGFLVYAGVDQLDVTGPFEVLSKLPGARCGLYAPEGGQVRDLAGLVLTADAAISEAPQLDVLVVPGGPGQEDLMEAVDVLGWLRHQAAGASLVLSVCTGALLLGAAGLLDGRCATTHWSVRHLLPAFGATPVDQRVVEDRSLISAAGVTSGIDGAFLVVQRLWGDEVAQAIQLSIEYAPEPRFDAGIPDAAPAAIVERVRRSAADITARREASAWRHAKSQEV
ncbi:DJ-1/PfpI family protein [Sphingomonas sp. BK580]|uniref:DJ-1/PfpI family protein n=1 Tax=Sphingomonas sp. BK580 TaxID=2586972 RepID=UPI0017AED6A4|nr:DJ-1/PfpI family protein [Sphingomonas sp. BK580]MBB3693548.1 cyclohexyl-isocyanide hydratase [Sphingomonas sp. BK580]